MLFNLQTRDKVCILSLFVSILIAWQSKNKFKNMTNPERLSPGDPNSYSRPDIAKVTHIHLKLDIDFESKILKGSATLDVTKIDPKAQQVVLDARGLNIEAISDDSNGQPLKYTLHEEGYIGSKLDVQLPISENGKVKIKIDYHTSPKCTALQWLSPSQTAGKKHPYVFSQCQAIHARSMVPCQDSPSVKMPYTADVTIY